MFSYDFIKIGRWEILQHSWIPISWQTVAISICEDSFQSNKKLLSNKDSLFVLLNNSMLSSQFPQQFQRIVPWLMGRKGFSWKISFQCSIRMFLKFIAVLVYFQNNGSSSWPLCIYIYGSVTVQSHHTESLRPRDGEGDQEKEGERQSLGIVVVAESHSRVH